MGVLRLLFHIDAGRESGRLDVDVDVDADADAVDGMMGVWPMGLV